MSNNLTRFSNRVDNYLKYRPGYPAEIIQYLSQHCGLTPQTVIADIGSGTGILTRLFLDNGNPVYAVEPNTEMREAAEILLANYPSFTSIDGQAENPGLSAGSVDFIVAGQAFHWFEPDATRQAFDLILKSGGWVTLIWNDRGTTDSAFLQDYEQMLLTYTDAYAEVNHRNIDASKIEAFFAPGKYHLANFENTQQFDFASLRGRLLSSSYTPLPDSPKYPPMITELRRIFDAHQCDNHVIMQYTTRLYYGQWLPR